MNIRKHASASRVTVVLRSTVGGVEMTVEDDGRGFDLNAHRENKPETAFGLTGMSERVDLIGGNLDITSAPQRGTKIEVRVPLDVSTRERPL